MQIEFDKLVLPLASSMVGLIPILINLTVNWADRKSKTVRLNTFLQQTNQRVGFLQTWFNLQKEVSSPEQLTQVKGILSNELQEIYETFTEALLDSDNEINRRHELIQQYRKTNPLQRFLLLYPPYNSSGWLFHTLYYMCILPLIIGVGYIIYDYVQTKSWIDNIPQEYLYAVAGLLVLLFTFRFLGRISAKEIEERLATVARKTAPLRANGS